MYVQNQFTLPIRHRVAIKCNERYIGLHDYSTGET